MPDVIALRPGDPVRIARYAVVGRLGSGGQGVVYLATDPTSGARVAIKQLLAGVPGFFEQDPKGRERLQKEVAAARRVAPFCTAQVLDADLTGDSPYVVSEYIDGPSLQQRVRDSGPITGSALHWLAMGTATALAAIHQAGVVHRDFKPANVMLASDGPRVIDFGIARDLSMDTTVTSRVMGTPAYMAPEQLRNEDVGPPADLFAWASVIAYAGTGRAPFDAGHVAAVMHRIMSAEPDLSGLPPDLTTVLSRCLAKDARERPTAQQVVSLLLGRRIDSDTTEESNPNRVLAQAAGIVHRGVAPAGAAAPTARDVRPPTQTPPAQTSPPQHPPVQHPPVQHPPVQHPPTQPEHSPTQRSTTGRTVAIAAGVVLLAAVIWGASQLNSLGSGDQAGSSGTATSRAASPAPVTTTAQVTAPVTTQATTQAATDSPTGTVDPSTVVPARFDGTWEGTGHQPLGQVRTWTAKIKLETGATDGEIELEELNCKGPVTVVSSSSTQLVLDAVMDDNPDGTCAPGGRIRMDSILPGRATFTWTDSTDVRNTAYGTLDRD